MIVFWPNIWFDLLDQLMIVIGPQLLLDLLIGSGYVFRVFFENIFKLLSKNCYKK